MFEGEGKLLNLEVLQLWELPELESIGISFPCLQTLKIWNCPKMKQIEEILECTKGNLKTLWIAGDISLKTLYTSEFINLRTLKVESCLTLSNVSSSSLPPANIENMDIRYCEKLQTLFADSNSADYELRCLKKLHLEDLPMLESIGAALPPLEDLFVMDCEGLKI
ncbi:NB-ARC domains-containing protein [Artemisia annua]|uniref:NB-ARC domains-containing protein n=1 Tax=Artemisia annua TaxID=35608 RepID=A0A2U1MJ52_ARTAN|nr:NB-ARC domains-containing protein [Artemisia annua]